MSLTTQNNIILDRISSGLSELKEMSAGTFNELCKQSDQLEIISKNTENANETLKGASKNIEEISKGVSGNKVTAIIGISHTAALIGSAFVAPVVGPVVVSMPFFVYYVWTLAKK